MHVPTEGAYRNADYRRKSEMYKNEGKYQHIHGLGTMDAIFADIVAAVEKL